MRNTRLYLQLAIMSAVLVITSATYTAAQAERVIFSPSSTATQPDEGLSMDLSGNLYGSSTTQVWQLIFKNNHWTQKIVYDFASSSNVDPKGGVVGDELGNLYGVTQYGGDNLGGSVFELMPQPHGTWTKVDLHSFGTGEDGSVPVGGLVRDANGNLFGTTDDGGTYGDGTVFEVSRQSDGTWIETVLHSFSGTDGANPVSALVIDSAGNLFGETSFGGTNYCAYFQQNCGTVFELMPQSDGSWTEKTLVNFNGPSSGEFGTSPLIFDRHGNLYGEASLGSTYGYGLAFELMPQSDGSWKEKILHIFGSGNDGAEPRGGMAIDTAGNLYGVTLQGGGNNCQPVVPTCGTVFELIPTASGPWREKMLHAFSNSTDGQAPFGIVLTPGATIYGTTWFGGASGFGTVFQVKH